VVSRGAPIPALDAARPTLGGLEAVAV